MEEYGIFNDESADWTEEEAVEAAFYSRLEAETALRDRYHEDDELIVHRIEEADDDPELEEEESEEDADEYPRKY